MADASATYTVPLFINGEHRRASESFNVTSPGTGEVLYRCSSSSIEDAKAAVNAASEAFTSWRRSTPTARRDILLKAAEFMAQRQDELARYMTCETGAAEAWARFNVATTIDMIKDVAGRVMSLEGSFPTTKDADSSAIVMKEPYGVVLAIAPWNAPYILGARAIMFPVAAGNTVVFKGSELAPRTMGALVSVFHEAGLPKGVLNTVFHKPASAASITSMLIAHPRVKKVNFTGSTNVGRIIGRLAGENIKPVVLELGGKAPAIVWEDADLQIAASQCALGAFLNSGQICMSTEKILVHGKIKAAFHEKFTAAVQELYPSSRDAPILVNSVGVAKNKNLISDATNKGASILFGDLGTEEKTNTMMRPLAVAGVTKDMDIYHTESFGPTVSLIEIETEDEAVEIANDTEFGLSSAVFTEDLRRGLRLARRIDAGAVHINSMSVHDESALPHGGTKASGYGRFNTASGLEEWVWTKNITFKN